MPKYVFDHVHLQSPDPVKTAEFYEKMFGAKRVNTAAGPGGASQMINLSLNGVTILISQTRDGASGLVHFGVRTDNLNQAVARFEECRCYFQPRNHRGQARI